MERRLRELVRKDFERLVERERLYTTAENERLILLQSVEGHAHNGHGEFRQRRHVDVTTADVVEVLGLDAGAVKAKRQNLIDDIYAWAELAIEGNQPDNLTNRDGKPLLGIPYFADVQVNALEVLKGLYVGGTRDDVGVRAAVEAKYKIRIGGGSSYLVDTVVMRRMGLDGEKLAHEPHDADIGRFLAQGLIVNPGDTAGGDDSIRYMYIRHREGPGHSDDAAIVSAGVLYGRDAALGVFLADAIDTLDKYASYYRDQDQDLAAKIKTSGAFDEEWDEAVEAITYLAAAPEDNDDLPDSSLRYFLLIDPETERCALLTHLDFIDGKPTVPILLGHSRIKSNTFYKYMREKLAGYAARVPEPRPF